ncbi:hypothetical protein FOL47_005165 [Perkinsus chesapeaki]|uniref:Uncharacterized protein n=1 Tax=Perkinsus chesapeaki TaxID=330153 RepID=A0A7J6MYR8_PERCH|nr:hypothetical protein FOL47_005165 [Perkinsus chesapeaki]
MIYVGYMIYDNYMIYDSLSDISHYVKNDRPELRSCHLPPDDATGVLKENVKDVAETAAVLFDPDVPSYERWSSVVVYEEGAEGRPKIRCSNEREEMDNFVASDIMMLRRFDLELMLALRSDTLFEEII